MGRAQWVVAGLVLLSACGSADGSANPPSQMTEPSGSITHGSATVLSTAATTPATTETTAVAPIDTSVDPTVARFPVEATFTRGRVGESPEPMPGSAGALGSGCAPGPGALPDGVWFGWITETRHDEMSFDLSCVWPGRIHDAVSNDNPGERALPVSFGALVYTGSGEEEAYGTWSTRNAVTPADNAPGLPDHAPAWVFINDGAVTEAAIVSRPVPWARSSNAWPELSPGCCDGGPIAPASPATPFPIAGWPADGFYHATLGPDAWIEHPDDYWMIPAAVDQYELTLRKWVSCEDRPGLCPDWWSGDEVATDPEASALVAQLELDADLTVVISPIFESDSLVGNGSAYRSLLEDLGANIDRWITGDNAPDWPTRESLMRDPTFPFGNVQWQGEETGISGYRAPGGVVLTEMGWWFSLEIRDGKPILYIDAGQVAG